MNQPRPAIQLCLEPHLMEKVVSRDNMLLAWKRVKQNQGAPGVDGRSIEETQNYLKTQWPKIKRFLLDGGYVPQPVRKVEIPKPTGGMRQLGIPTVVDRLIQQGILQVLQPFFDPTFHPQSYGFRPGKSAHQAIRQVHKLIGEGHEYCVDVDIEKFFDRVNHDLLMDRIGKRIKDERLIRIIRRYLQAGMMSEGVCVVREEGTPQGGPLSPLLSNLLLDEIDWELERRGLRFVRYADDCNVYLKSQRAADRTLRTMKHLLSKLKLRANAEKSSAGKACTRSRKFLGYSMTRARGGEALPRVSPQAVERFKQRVRTLTGRTQGRSIEYVVRQKLNPYVRGWRNYFCLAENKTLFTSLDRWIRRRLRVMQLKQWKNAKTCYRELRMRGLPQDDAYPVSVSMRRWWRASQFSGMLIALDDQHYRNLGLEGLSLSV